LAVTKNVETGAITESQSFHERMRTISWCHIVMRTPAQLNIHIDFDTLSEPYLHAAYAANWLNLTYVTALTRCLAKCYQATYPQEAASRSDFYDKKNAKA